MQPNNEHWEQNCEQSVISKKQNIPHGASYVAIAEAESHIVSERMMLIQKEYKQRR